MGCRDRLPWAEKCDSKVDEASVRCEAKVQITEDIREWDYGDYEGLTSKQVCRTIGLTRVVGVCSMLL